MVIERLHIINFAVARDVEVEPAPGLNVFTGETGAGKSLVVDALAFAFGGKRGREVVGPWGDRAAVVVHVIADSEPHRIERTVTTGGRSSARVDGQTATVEMLQELGSASIDIHGQSEQLGLLRTSVQRALLDQFGGIEAQRMQLTDIVRRMRALSRQLEALVSGARDRERRLDQLRFEVAEISDAAPEPGEDEALRAEQQRLGASQSLRESVALAMEALDAPGVPEAVSAIEAILSIDSTAENLGEIAAALDASASDLRRLLRSYADTIEEDPARLESIAGRLDLLARLKRKYGDTIEAVLEYEKQASEELARLEGGEASLEELHSALAALRTEAASIALELSRARRRAAAELCDRVTEELRLLGMEQASLGVAFAVEDDDDGPEVDVPDYDVVTSDWEPPPPGQPHPRAITESGIDRVEFLASFNPGQDPRPLAAVASGGEASRFLLALTAVFAAVDAPRTIVLDEIDEGVGGRSGVLVGEALARLARHHQVLSITHLPQVAAFGERHFVVAKGASEAGLSTSTIAAVEDLERTSELASMLGGVTAPNLEAARDLLVRATPT